MAIFNLFSILRRREKRLLQEKIEAEESAGKSRSYFFSTMSHDIRTPMNAIIGLTTIAEKLMETREKYGAELPVFVTGDFNAHPESDSIQNMKKVLPDSADIATVSATTGVNSFHRVPGQPCPEGTPIDFVFVTDDAVKVLVHCIADDETALAISDHCPVYVDAKIN